MAALTHNFGLELPEYDPSRIIKPSRKAVQEAGSAFVRGIFISSAFRDYSLKETLAIADKSFAKAADYCGAVVVQHTWGIASTPWEALQLPESFGIPRARLVAEVEVVAPQYSSPNNDPSILEPATWHLLSGATRLFGWRWYDASSSQFTHGSSQTYPDPQFHLTDIDIRLCR